MPTPLERLIRRLKLAYEFAIPDQRTLADSIYKQRAETWRATLTNEARTVGSSKVGQGPRGTDRDTLRKMSATDAESIAKTWNRDLEREITRLYEANPAGRRDYYVSNLVVWADNRAEWKDRQIANQNRGTAQQFAQERFDQENEITDALFVFTGPPPREIHCADHFLAGAVTAEFMRANKTPVHLNCPHEWRRIQSTIGVPLAELWTG